MSKVSFIDLFAGIGGFRLAMEAAGAECLFSSELDKYAQQTYLANFGDIPHGDICNIQAKDIPAHDILCAGFPCQPFSIAGKQLGFIDPRGNMFWEIMRIVEFHRPKALLLENVRHLISHDNGRTIKIIRYALKQAGYRIFEAVLNSGDFGVPQRRKRIFFVCIRKDLTNCFSYPLAPHIPIVLQDILQPVKADDPNKKYLIRRNDFRFDWGKVFSMHQNRQNDPIRIGVWNQGCQGERIYSPYGHAITLSALGGGGGARTGAYLIDGVVRKLTPRECARAQGFPDTFKIPVSDSQAYKQFGNSVAVPVVTAIAQNLCRTLLEKSVLSEG